MATVDRKSLVEGAIKGMIGALGDPYSQYMTSDEFKASLQGHRRPVRGDRGHDRDGGPDRRHRVVRNPRRRVPARDRPPADRVAGREGGPAAGRRDRRDRRHPARGPHRRRRAGQGPRARRTRPSRSDRARRQGCRSRSRSGARSSSSPRSSRGTSPTARPPTSSSTASRTERRTTSTRRSRAAVERGQKQILVDLRGNPGGLVTAARDDRQPVPPRRHDLLGGGQPGEPDGDHGQARRRSRPTRRSASRSSSTAARRRRPRSSTGALHDRDRAIVVGSKTFGKGTVQQWTQLEDDSGGFRLTIAKWLTPDKTWVHGVGDHAGRRGRRRAGEARRRPGRRRGRSRPSATTATGSAPAAPAMRPAARDRRA